MCRPAVAVAIVLAAAALGLEGCGSGSSESQTGAGIPAALVAQARPIGRGARFHPPLRGDVAGRCTPRLGARFGSHVEVFAENRVVLIAAGIGTRPPRGRSAGRISSARCYGDLVTIDPTGLVLIRPGTRRTLADLFRSWGQPLSATRVGPFATSPGTRVAAFVGGRRWPGLPDRVPLTRHSEIVLEVGPHVAPHTSYAFPLGM